MGSRNADNRRRLDRATVTQMIADLDKLAGLGLPDDPRSAAMQSAAAMLRQLAPRQNDIDPLEDPALQAHCYRTDTEPSTKQVRILFFRDRKEECLLGYTIMDTPEVYDMASALMRQYDKLEGIK